MSRVDNFEWKRRVWLRRPHCHWCGIEMILVKTGPKPGTLPDNMATIDHLRSKYHPGRREPNKPGEIRRVLACYKCNNERERAETERIKQESIQELWERSGSYPLYLREQGRDRA